LAALNGHSRCIRLLLADYIPSIADCWEILSKGSKDNESISEFDGRYFQLLVFFALLSSFIMILFAEVCHCACTSALREVINRPADGGITALHMAALNGHVESVQLLLDLGASVYEVTVEDGTTIDLIGDPILL
jgi:E3 ubiquitin-protein ligase XBAT32/33